jgi:hypothetical protein
MQIAYLRAHVFPHFLAPSTPCPTTLFWLLSWVGEEGFVQINTEWFTSIHRHDCQITVIRQSSPVGWNLSLQRFFASTYCTDSACSKGRDFSRIVLRESMHAERQRQAFALDGCPEREEASSRICESGVRRIKFALVTCRA